MLVIVFVMRADSPMREKEVHRSETFWLNLRRGMIRLCFPF